MLADQQPDVGKAKVETNADQSILNSGCNNVVDDGNGDRLLPNSGMMRAISNSNHDTNDSPTLQCNLYLEFVWLNALISGTTGSN